MFSSNKHISMMIIFKFIPTELHKQIFYKPLGECIKNLHGRGQHSSLRRSDILVICRALVEIYPYINKTSVLASLVMWPWPDGPSKHNKTAAGEREAALVTLSSQRVGKIWDLGCVPAQQKIVKCSCYVGKIFPCIFIIVCVACTQTHALFDILVYYY